MKHIKIRQKVHETNSSSTHSVSIAEITEDTILATIEPTFNYEKNKMEIILTGGEYGWAWDKFNDAREKADYLYTYAQTWVDCNWKETKQPEKKEKYLAVLAEVIEKQTGFPVIFGKFDESTDSWTYTYGYIDHQSAEDSDYDYLFEDPEQMRQFIFNPKSLLFTGNDNDTPPNKHYDPIDAVYPYRLVIGEDDGAKLNWDLMEIPTGDAFFEIVDLCIKDCYDPISKTWIDSWGHNRELFKYGFKGRYNNEDFNPIDEEKQEIILNLDSLSYWGKDGAKLTDEGNQIRIKYKIEKI